MNAFISIASFSNELCIYFSSPKREEPSEDGAVGVERQPAVPGKNLGLQAESRA